MKKIYPIFLVLFILLSFKQEDPKLQNIGGKFVLPKGVTEKDYLPNTLIIKFKKSGDKQTNGVSSSSKTHLNAIGVSIVSLDKLFPAELKSTGIQSLAQGGSPDLSDLYIAKYESNQNITTVINTLLKDEQIIYAEPSYIYKMSYQPNDPGYASQQGYLTKLQVAQAWDLIRDASPVIIGIVDSGSDLQHEDLAGNVYLNTADPINGIDDDKDGYIDNYYGWDFVGRSASTMIGDNNPDVTSDSTGHGVHVSGIAGAVSDNGKGVASIGFNAKLMIIKAGSDDNSKAIYKGYEGIKYAADRGVKIINCSWGGPGGGLFGQEMIDYAVSKGSLVIAAAGNEGAEGLDYPAAYRGVLSVASVTNTDIKSGFSSYGYGVDISAPGSSIYNTLNGNKYGFISGTSMSTPMVSSAAALVKMKYPNYDGLQIGEVLRTTADPIDGLNPSYANKLGKGRLNIYNALTQATSSVRYQKVTVADQSNGNRAAGSELTLNFDLKSFLAPVNGLSVGISSTSQYVQILDPILTVGNMGTLESKTNIGPVRVKVLANAPQNQEVNFKLTYTGNGGSYTDVEFYSVTVALDFLNVVVNKVSTTFSSNGRVGFSKANASSGLGFVYKDESLLFEASLLIGKSATQVSNNARNDGNYSEDFTKLISAAKVNGSQAAFEGVTTFSDEKTTNPIGLKVKSRMIAHETAPDDKYVIVEYEITNTTTSTLQGIYTGMFNDWDLDEASYNGTKYDAATKTAYAYARKNIDFPYVGVRLLANSAPAAYYPMSFQLSGNPLSDSKFTTAEKYTTLSSGIYSQSLGTESTNNGYDIMFIIGSGPYTIPANGSITVAYAYVAGDNLTDLLNAGNAALTKYSKLPTKPVEPVPNEVKEFLLKQNYPNPAKSTTNIPFSLAEKSETNLTITNVSGKVIQTLVNETLNAGNYSIPFDLTRIPAGVYFYKLRAGSYQKTLKMIVVK